MQILEVCHPKRQTVSDKRRNVSSAAQKKQKMAQMTHERVRMFVFVSKMIQIVVTLCVLSGTAQNVSHVDNFSGGGGYLFEI